MKYEFLSLSCCHLLSCISEYHFLLPGFAISSLPEHTVLQHILASKFSLQHLLLQSHFLLLLSKLDYCHLRTLFTMRNQLHHTSIKRPSVLFSPILILLLCIINISLKSTSSHDMLSSPASS